MIVRILSDLSRAILHVFAVGLAAIVLAVAGTIALIARKRS